MPRTIQGGEKVAEEAWDQGGTGGSSETDTQSCQMYRRVNPMKPVVKARKKEVKHTCPRNDVLSSLRKVREKDLHRTTVSLQRCENNLSTQLDDSEKRLKKAFEEVRRQLHERELVLLNDFNDIKRQTESLIDTRIKTASELKMKIAKANSLSEQELLELRASLKHFVVRPEDR
ncbi:putative ribosome-binding protein 1 [Apostichopus japonicus]|uniref:Putative ribosome-binding protein 1 n=1 Tax=Stichopus japonicus TaxID=307972 RepID=A0A2G8JJB1_STIJA|nr:putative ribosome-binding protein 1 [Apostichopus japonicus]